MILEPVALKKANLITGVAEGYYSEAIRRNPHLQKIITGAMPYGGEILDHERAKNVIPASWLFKRKEDTFQFVYAGAMLPHAYGLLEKAMQSIAANPAIFSGTEFHFIGTGRSTNDPAGFTIRPLAEKYGLWQSAIFEYPQRIPYMDVLAHLNRADGIFILGSIEAHYTPSKIYQGILSGKPLLALLHKESTAANVIRQTKTGVVVSVDPASLDAIKQQFPPAMLRFLQLAREYDFKSIDTGLFDTWSAKNVTGKLAVLLDKAVALSDV